MISPHWYGRTHVDKIEIYLCNRIEIYYYSPLGWTRIRPVFEFDTDDKEFSHNLLYFFHVSSTGRLLVLCVNSSVLAKASAFALVLVESLFFLNSSDALNFYT